jgi:hypothetical protein
VVLLGGGIRAGGRTSRAKRDCRAWYLIALERVQCCQICAARADGLGSAHVSCRTPEVSNDLGTKTQSSNVLRVTNQRCVRISRITVDSAAKFVNTLKIALFSMAEFDVVLFADLDVDIAPWLSVRDSRVNPSWLPRWQASIAAFLGSNAVLVASPDHASPVSTGLLLVKPSLAVHADALSLLRNTLTFSPTQGFNRCGPPRALEMNMTALAAGFLGYSSATRRSTSWKNDLHSRRVVVAQRLNRTVARTSSVWRFVAADIDQGFFFYFFYHRHRALATWAEDPPLASDPSSWTVMHYWGPYKPWRPAGIDHNSHVTVRYLWRLEAIESARKGSTRHGHAQSPTRCTRELQRIRAALRSKGRWFEPPRANESAQPRRGMGKVAVFPILPSPRVREM